VNDELKRMWKEEVVAYNKVLCRHLPVRAEKNHENLNQDSRDLNTGPPEYKAGVLATGPLYSVGNLIR
jgi:hypothetical protein